MITNGKVMTSSGTAVEYGVPLETTDVHIPRTRMVEVRRRLDNLPISTRAQLPTEWCSGRFSHNGNVSFHERGCPGDWVQLCKQLVGKGFAPIDPLPPGVVEDQ